MQTEDLGGEWTLKQSGKRESISATVPGSVDVMLFTKEPLSIAEIRQRFRFHSLIDTYE